MGRIVALTGNAAVAEAMRQTEPDVCAAYPITPSTQVMETFSRWVADGLVRTELVAVESEHSAISACVGAVAAGARVMTATSSQGLALMHEVLYIAAGMRLPIVMAVANRALSAPLNIHGDHSDTMGSRDAGWIQLYSENAQEAYDNLIQAVRIAEHPDVRLPVMVCFDGFTISHSLERVEVLEDEAVRAFIGPLRPRHALLDVEHPVTYGALDLPDYYTEHKRQQREAMARALPVIAEIGEDFGQRFGRPYGLFEAQGLEGAESAVVVMSSAAGVAATAAAERRRRGQRTGFLKIRSYRPFPVVAAVAALEKVPALAVLDRADSFGALGGPLFLDIRAALYDLPQRPACINYIYGLGGRDVLVEDLHRVYDDLAGLNGTVSGPALSSYLTLRG